MNKMTRNIAIAIAVAGLLGTSVTFAQSQTDQPQSQAPSMNSGNMQRMMEGMQGGDMMGMMNMMSQMSEMMKTCNQMMQAMQPDQDGPTQDGGQPNRG